VRAQLLGSGAILNEAVKAQALLAEKFGVQADVWSVTSYKELLRDATDCERWNRLHPGAQPRAAFVAQQLGDAPGVIVAASDYLKALPLSLARWLPRPLLTLGTDGFGRSDGRDHLRRFFEVDAHHIALAALAGLAQQGDLKAEVVVQAIKEFDIDPEKANPLLS
jgi:pyruvate dehydrogenase E1 component